MLPCFSWTLVMWTVQMLSTHTVVSLPPPVNVSIQSFNLEHKLTWLPGNATPTSTRFRVQSHRGSGLWLDVPGCVSLGESCDLSCDLTLFLEDAYDPYVMRVQAFSPALNATSPWTPSQTFHPIADTVLGPPVLQVSGCGACLQLHISPPTTRGQQQMINFLYHTLRVNLTRTRDRAQFSLSVQSGESMIGYLEPEAEYCVTVVVVTTSNLNIVPSHPHCVYTSPTSVNTVLVMVCVLTALSLMVALFFCAALLYSGLLLPHRKPLPKTLSSVSSLAGSPPWMSAQVHDPVHLITDQPEHTHTLITYQPEHTHTLISDQPEHTHTLISDHLATEEATHTASPHTPEAARSHTHRDMQGICEMQEEYGHLI
ncbi:cytokine receptor family member b1 isoform X1 [Alosa sapidissima]|uniref:cytokine receptor family member b1 isoform X1 n=1 Tax=Alosa sapidissima TaxID=34773 RepID=UPI001C081A29|nr:cytokine receptor family member b1 isoform X1 [Alosa sapidissima]